MQKLRIAMFLVLLPAMPIFAQNRQSLPPYHPNRQVTGTIRITGKQNTAKLIRLWDEGFRKYHPSARIKADLHGTASAMAGVYTGTGDIAIMGREMWDDSEAMAFKWVFRHEPVEIHVANGSFTTPKKSPPLVIFVNKDNPLTELTLAQLEGIFGAEHKRGCCNVRTWGDVGLKGKWANRPIHPYGHVIGGGYGIEFQRRIMKNSFKWNCALQEFANGIGRNGSSVDAGHRVIAALSQDPYGIAYTGSPYANSQVKAIAIASEDGGEAVMPTRESVLNRRYPLTRSVNFFFNREPGQPLEPRIDEFVRYVLSREGQAQINREGEFLPLDSTTVQVQLRKLE